MQYPEIDVEGAGSKIKDTLGLVVLVFFLVLSLGATAYPFYLFVKFQTVKSYVPVAAWVVDIRDRHEQRRGNVTVYYTVEYDYAYDGKVFRGSNASLVGEETVDADRVNGWAEAKREGRTITAWVDPQSPGTSLLDRNLDTTMIAVSSFAALVGATFVYWVLYLARAPKERRVPGAFYAFPFKRHLHWLTYWSSFSCFVACLYSGCLALVGSFAAPWMMGLAGLSGWILSKVFARRRFFVDLGLVEVRWLSPLAPGKPVDLEIRLSRPESLEYIELSLTCIGHPASGSFEPQKHWFKRQFTSSDFRPSTAPGTFITSLVLPADVPPTTLLGDHERAPHVTWTFTLQAPSFGKYAQTLVPVVG